MYIVASYAVYLSISLGVTVWVARTLARNGRIFLLDAFHGRTELGDSVNHMLVVGFYLVNIGYVALALRTAASTESAREAIELVSDKLGVVLVVLGVLDLSNLYVFNQLRRRGERTSPPPPPRIVPAGHVLD
jgi:hypothetical protein